MATATLVSASVDPVEVLSRLGESLLGPDSGLRAWMDSGEELRQQAARTFFEHRDLDALASLRLRESVAWSRLDRHQQAFTAAHEAWVLVAGKAPGPIQALVLTQLAACAHRRGDLRGAIRSVRRAEALLVADAGEDSPQVLAVRSQLLALLREKKLDTSAAATRRDHTLGAILFRARDAGALARFRRLVEVFAGPAEPPSWAYCYVHSWRNVHSHA